jgi:hypothetical protein
MAIADQLRRSLLVGKSKSLPPNRPNPRLTMPICADWLLSPKAGNALLTFWQKYLKQTVQLISSLLLVGRCFHRLI